MIDNMWFDTLQQTFSKMYFFFMKIVTGVTVTTSEDQYIRSYVCHWWLIVSLVLLCCVTVLLYCFSVTFK